MFADFWPSAPKRNSISGSGPPAPRSTTTPIPEGSLTAQRKPESAHQWPPPPPLQSLEEREQLRQHVEASLAAQHNTEDKWRKRVERDVWPSILPEGDRGKGEPIFGSPRQREREPDTAVGVVDVLKEENDKLKVILRRHVQQLDTAHEEMERQRSEMQAEAAKLKGELNAAGEAHKREVERLKQEHAEQIEQLIVEHGELDDLKHRLEGNGVELTNIRNALRREGESLKGATEENRMLKEEIAELNASHRRAVDESTALLQSLKGESEAKIATQQLLRQEKDEKDRVLSQNERLTRELEDLRYHLDANDIELRSVQHELQHESYKNGAAENRRLRESLKREQEDRAATQRSLRQEVHEKAGALSRNEQLTRELEGLRRQLESKDVDLKNLRNALQQEESLEGRVEENRMLKEEVAKLQASHRRAVDESTALSQSLKREREGKAATRAMGELDSLRHRLEGKEAELDKLRSALEQSQTKHDELATLLETRSRNLKGAQVHSTKADGLSSAEVIALVNALNVEILQTSAFISDSFDYTHKPAYAGRAKAASARISEFIGPTLARLIGTVSHSDNDLLVQIALQSAAVELSHRIILTWNFDDLQDEQEQPLVKLYNNIREIETQAVGGRWRALTRAHAQMVAQQGDSHATLVTRISGIFVGILVAARCTKSYEETHRTITDNFGGHISSIVKMALRLNKAIGEEVTSADLRPVNVTSGKKFDESTMADFESGKEDLKGQIVLCTTALGMQRSERVARGDAVEFETTILLKPKVAVESVVVDAVDVTR